MNQNGTILKTMHSAKVQQQKDGGVNIILPSQEDMDVISTDTEVSDEYGSASDSSSSIDKFTTRIPATLSLKVNGALQVKPSEQSRFTPSQMQKCKQIWSQADAVCFDVDSTVCIDEAIDELAKYVGKSKEVSDITKAAMLGGASFRDALADRLEIIKPTTQMLAQYLKLNPPRLTPHIKELVKRLHELGRDVYLISGGFDVIIYPAAEILNIPTENVFSNSIKFFYDGSYAGFEKSRPTSNQDGKARVIDMLKRTKHHKKVVMIGDGVTDLEACPPADAFIGFGGNQVRETVKMNCDWFVDSFEDLLQALAKN